MDDVAIKVEGLHKSFKLPHEKSSSLKGAFVNVFRGKQSFETQKVLKNISFEIKKGEFFGIVGRNGSGKSTLLKLLAGIYTPDKGQIHVNGKLTPFIELGVGFNPELSGRENVYLNGALLGFNRKEMDAMYAEIVEFAELEKFMDQKLKNYSSGMQVRLAFSIAIRSNGAILLIDEVLAVGDTAFQKKCFDVFNDIKRSGRTVVFVTHDMSAVERYCERAVLIDKGMIVGIGKSSDIGREYTSLMQHELAKGLKISDGKINRIGNGFATITKSWIEDVKGEKILMLDGSTKKMKIVLRGKANRQLSDPIFGFTIYEPNGGVFLVSNTRELGVATGDFDQDESFIVEWTISNIFNGGNYSVTPAVADNDGITVYDSVAEMISIRSIRDYGLTGAAYSDQVIRLKKKV